MTAHNTSPKSGADIGLPASLIEFAKKVKTGADLSEEEYLFEISKVMPISEIPDLSREEAEWLAMAVCWLNDLCTLLVEYHEVRESGEGRSLMGAPCLVGPSGPFIDTVLTRCGGDKPDFTILEKLRRASIN